MKRTLGISLILFLIVVLGIFVSYHLFFTPQIQRLPMELKVDNIVGVNTDTHGIFFGRVPPGGQTKRKITLENNNNYAVRVNIKIEGDIQDFISVSDNNFVLSSGEKMEVTYYASPPRETPLGNYTGSTTVMFSRVLFS